MPERALGLLVYAAVAVIVVALALHLIDRIS